MSKNDIFRKYDDLFEKIKSMLAVHPEISELHFNRHSDFMNNIKVDHTGVRIETVAKS